MQQKNTHPAGAAAPPPCRARRISRRRKRVINSPKYKTINDVFTHHYEALRRWRAFICLPHRMPEAVRYYVAQQLDDPNAILGLWVVQPEHRNAVALAFADKSVLVWPDFLFHNEVTYDKAIDCIGDLEGLDKIWVEVERLARPRHADELFSRAVEFLESFACFLSDTGAQNVLAPKVRALVSELNGRLASAFWGQKRHACDWLRMVDRAREIGFALRLSPDATATLSQNQKPPRQGRLARSLRPHWPRRTKWKVTMAFPPSKIKVVFDRDRHVQRCDCSDLLQSFDPKIMLPEALRQHCGTVQILFRGYQDDSRLPMVIPELRAFVRAIRRIWPYAPYFCDLHTFFLEIEAFAHLDHYSVVEKSDSEEILFIICTPELRRYVRQAHKTIQMLGEHSCMTRAQVRRRVFQFDNYISARMGPFRKTR